VLLYFYPQLPDRVPEYLNLHGEVEVWGHKSFASVFRLPLMAVDLQVLCLLTKYGLWQAAQQHPNNHMQAPNSSPQPAGDGMESLNLYLRLFEWFRAFIAIKLGVSSLEVIFFSIERFKFLTTFTRIASWSASICGVSIALFYSYRLSMLNRGQKRRRKEMAASTTALSPHRKSHLYGGILYFNPDDPSWFAYNYLPNFGNRWVYIFLACLLCLPLLMFWPLLN